MSQRHKYLTHYLTQVSSHRFQMYSAFLLPLLCVLRLLLQSKPFIKRRGVTLRPVPFLSLLSLPGSDKVNANFLTSVRLSL